MRVSNHIKESFPVIGWGMTELAPAGTLTAVDEVHPGSCGRLCINTEAKFVDMETGELLGPNQRGSLPFEDLRLGKICSNSTSPEILPRMINSSTHPDYERILEKSRGNRDNEA